MPLWGNKQILIWTAVNHKQAGILGMVIGKPQFSNLQAFMENCHAGNVFYVTDAYQYNDVY